MRSCDKCGSFGDGSFTGCVLVAGEREVEIVILLLLVILILKYFKTM